MYVMVVLVCSVEAVMPLKFIWQRAFEGSLQQDPEQSQLGLQETSLGPAASLPSPMGRSRERWLSSKIHGAPD